MAEDKDETSARSKTLGGIDYISEIIAAINPDKYSKNNPSVKSEIKRLVKKGDFWQAVKLAKPNPAEEHRIVYDSTSETLEPIYFWILDFLGQRKVVKLIDNFASSPGSGHFSELMSKATIMQKEAMNLMQTTGILIKSIINLIYDLKEFEVRLSQYKLLKNEKKEEREAGLLGLKQIWLDNVDMKKGVGSINALTRGDLMFTTLRDAFMIVKEVREVDELDLNDRVKRLLKPRLAEFLEWKNRSEKELQKRYEIEKTYLKSQVAALKTYTRWAKPYLKSAALLEQKDMGNSPAIVNAFNSIVFELLIMQQNKFEVQDAVFEKKIPQGFEKMKMRDYFGCVFVDFFFRGIPQKMGQHYVFGGRAEVTFRGYALNKEEISLLTKKLDESDLNDALKLVSGMTDDSLAQLKEDIDHFLEEKENEEEKKPENSNPFFALFNFGEWRSKDKKEKEKKKKEGLDVNNLKKDSFAESVIRKVVEGESKSLTFKVFDVYKKAHGMASHPSPFD